MPILFDDDASRRISKVVKMTEHDIRSTESEPPLPLIGAGTVFLGKSTSTISARSGTTPGSGTVQLQTQDESNNLTNSTTSAFTVYNSYLSSIASGKYVWLVRWGDKLWALTVDCG